MRKKAKGLIFVIYVLIAVVGPAAALFASGQSEKEPETIGGIIGAIQQLESNRDPKCHATATRLENFMYGTPLSADARFLKVKLQKQLITHLWDAVTADVKAGNKGKLADLFKARLAAILKYSRNEKGDVIIRRKQGKPILLEKRDMDHYFSVAYALRTILAVQQEALIRPGASPVTLDQESIGLLKEFIDIFSLAALQLADREARMANQYELSPKHFETGWNTVLHSVSKPAAVKKEAAVASTAPAAKAPGTKFATVFKIINQKVKSYEVYNKISMQVFLRNLQVYFARHQWPKDAQEGAKFRNLFTESMVSFAFNGLNFAGELAKKKGHGLILEEDVDEMWKAYVPFEVDEYEDVMFFPNLEKKDRLTIEAYDFDAFRDSGVHWRYLQFALQDHAAKLSVEPDPFAAELLVEGIAQFGVLVLRVAGITAKEKGDKQLNAHHLELALKEIERRILAHRKAKPRAKAKDKGVLVSSGGVTRIPAGKTFFDDVTQAAGIRFMHRSSDWLSRLLRSYLLKSKDVGTLDVPPAFGGSGAASGDINNDGIDDLLLLSGTGNALYLGDGKGFFKEVTKEAGIVFKRPDGQPGEPRQPLIADFDNDGKQDILITYANDNHKLYRNMGNGKFKDVSAGSNLGGEGLVGGPALAFDYDRDGLLDIYIGYFGDYLHGKLPTLNRRNLNALPNKLFRNTGNMVFEDVTAKSGTGNTGWGQAAAHTDLDGDGWQDIIVGNDFGINVYYRNRGDGTFENMAAKWGADKPSFTMNVGITDLNKDMLPDIYISNIVTMVKDEKYVLPGKDTTMRFNPAKLGNMRVIEANDMFLSDSKDGKLKGYKLSDSAVGRGYSSTGWSWGANFFDFDNDGDDDLYCVNGMNEYSVYSDTPYYTSVHKEKRQISLPVYAKESNVFFVNQGGKLENHSKESGTDYLGNSRSTVYIDFDRDGDLDIVLNNYHGLAKVYRNNSQQLNNNWLKIKLKGNPARKCNLDAIGAKVIVTKNGKQLAWRELRGGDGYLCMNPKTQHIGLGKEANVDVKVYWPNGETSEFKDVEANASYLVELGKEGLNRDFHD
jgi:hypothetical protein